MTDTPAVSRRPRFLAPCVLCDHVATGDTIVMLGADMDGHAAEHDARGRLFAEVRRVR